MTLFPLTEIRDHPEGKHCKTCIFLRQDHGHTRFYYKCALKGTSHSEATDIRLKDPACSRYKEKL